MIMIYINQDHLSLIIDASLFASKQATVEWSHLLFQLPGRKKW